MENMLDLLSQRGVSFRSISEDWCRTDTASGTLLLQLISSISQYERALILERTAAGRARAKAAGVKFGRKELLSDQQKKLMLEMIIEGQKTQEEIAALFNVTQGTISYQYRKMVALSS